jgi:hypothetical protein
MNFSQAGQCRRARMNLFKCFSWVNKEKRAGGGVLPILDQRQQYGVAFARLVSHCNRRFGKPSISISLQKLDRGFFPRMT